MAGISEEMKGINEELQITDALTVGKIGLNCPHLVPSENLADQVQNLLEYSKEVGITDLVYTKSGFQVSWFMYAKGIYDENSPMSVSFSFPEESKVPTHSPTDLDRYGEKMKEVIDKVLDLLPGKKAKTLILTNPLDPYDDHVQIEWLIDKYIQQEKIKGYGFRVTNYNPARLHFIGDMYDIALVPFSLFKQDALWNNTFNILKKKKIQPVIIEPLFHGFLSNNNGGISRPRRNSFPDKIRQHVRRSITEIREFTFHNELYNYTIRDVAIKFIQQTTTDIPIFFAVRNEEQLKQNLHSISLPDIPQNIIDSLTFHP